MAISRGMIDSTGNRSQFRVGQKVYFGRGNGEQTLGKIIKLNPTKAKVQTLEERGNGRGGFAGSTWTVPYSLMRAADETATPGTPAPPIPKQPLKYNHFDGEDNLILQAIHEVYGGLSPENLHADGERPITQVRRLYAEYQRKLKHLQLALGRDVDEGEIYEWARQRRQWIDQQAQKKQQQTA